ncbi:purine transporter [Calycina marina]|uniref:Purine transporter n=1 Tax=Calycina marina TaxID=1763456 RepID=A0A9P7YZZ4_9HELO|nr:purine transporter [Calycina marina]
MTDSGGTCPCDETDRLTCDKNLDYKLCLEDLRQEFSIATAAICAIATFSMGLLANVPIAVGPGMGLNAYFTYTVVGKYGSGLLEYRVALLAVFAEGLVFFALSAFGLRTWLARSIPRCVKQGSGVGIGLYLALIGFTYTAGIGAITPGTNTPIELAGCMPNLMVDGHCPSDVKMTSPRMWLGILCGGFLTLLLYSHRWKAAFIPGIILVSITSWPRDTPFTFFPHDVVGDKAFDFFKQVVAFRPLEHILGANAWYPPPGIRGQFFLVLVSMLYVDILDCTGTLYSMVAHARMIDNTGDFEGSAAAYTVDSLSITVGSLFGLSPVTAYIESGAGISMGAKTGIASMTTGLCFFISMFLAPIFASIPPWATGCTLMIVGGMMASGARHINWYYFGNSFPAFMTLATIPFTYSIAYGLIVGLVLFAFINTSSWLIEKVSRGRIVVPNRDQREDWDFAWPRLKGKDGGCIPPIFRHTSAFGLALNYLQLSDMRFKNGTASTSSTP